MQSTEPSRSRKSKAKAILPEGAAFQRNSIIQQNFAVSLEPQVSESQFRPSWVTLKQKRYQLIHQRRFSDVESVLMTIGCMEKLLTNGFQWRGRTRIPAKLREIQELSRAKEVEENLNAIIGSHTKICISLLTKEFLLCFPALR
jgi:hypothetical protein